MCVWLEKRQNWIFNSLKCYLCLQTFSALNNNVICFVSLPVDWIFCFFKTNNDICGKTSKSTQKFSYVIAEASVGIWKVFFGQRLRTLTTGWRVSEFYSCHTINSVIFTVVAFFVVKFKTLFAFRLFILDKVVWYFRCCLKMESTLPNVRVNFFFYSIKSN